MEKFQWPHGTVWSNENYILPTPLWRLDFLKSDPSESLIPLNILTPAGQHEQELREVMRLQKG